MASFTPPLEKAEKQGEMSIPSSVPNEWDGTEDGWRVEHLNTQGSVNWLRAWRAVSVWVKRELLQELYQQQLIE